MPYSSHSVRDSVGFLISHSSQLPTYVLVQVVFLKDCSLVHHIPYYFALTGFIHLRYMPGPRELEPNQWEPHECEERLLLPSNPLRVKHVHP